MLCQKSKPVQNVTSMCNWCNSVNDSLFYILTAQQNKMRSFYFQCTIGRMKSRRCLYTKISIMFEKFNQIIIITIRRRRQTSLHYRL